MTFKRGDLVLLLRCAEDSTAYREGLRAGHIGTANGPCECPRWAPCLQLGVGCTRVSFPACKNVCAQDNYLRLIPPPEAAAKYFDWRTLSEPRELENV